MCEVFAVSSARLTKLNQDLKEFYAHSDRHPNGWGLALYANGIFNWEKEPLCASESRYLKERLSEPIMSKTAMAHIRYATIGNVEWSNCHPFVATDKSGRQWTLMHNGTIFDFPPMNIYTSRQKGETDSERILLYLIDRVNERMDETGHVPDKHERFALVSELTAALSPGNKLNLIIHDEELLYCHTNCVGTLYRRQEDGKVTVCTQPVTGGVWKPVPLLRLIAYEDGRFFDVSDPHDGEYEEDAEAVAQLYLAYSGL